MINKLKILIHDYAGYGFIAELSRELASRGHQVVHIYGAHNPTPKGFVERLPGDPEGLSFHPITLSSSFQKYSFFKRWQQEREYGVKLASVVTEIHPDVVISANTPLDAERLLDQACKSAEIPLMHWLQDLIGNATDKVLRNKIPVFGGLIGKYYLAMEKELLQQANLILSISEDFTSLLKDWNIPPDKIEVIPNWPTLKHIPVLEKNNDWSIAHGLQDQFIFLYTGALGFKHNPEQLLALAQSFQDNPLVKVVVISEGPGAEWLKQKYFEKRINNLLILPYQSFEKYAQVLASGDVLVGILKADAGVYSVPSKILSYLCAHRPILLSIPLENKAARMVLEHGAGLVVAPDREGEFLEAAHQLLRDKLLRDRLAKNGRNYAEEKFDIYRIGSLFEKLLQVYY